MYENSLPALPKNKKVDELIIHPKFRIFRILFTRVLVLDFDKLVNCLCLLPLS